MTTATLDLRSQRRFWFWCGFAYLAAAPIFWVVGVTFFRKMGIEREISGPGVAILSLCPYLQDIALVLRGGWQVVRFVPV